MGLQRVRHYCATEQHHITQTGYLAFPPNMITLKVILLQYKVLFLKNLLVYVKMKSLSHVWLSATPWAVAYQAPLSMEFSRQEYCSELPFPSPGDLPDLGLL